MPISESNIFVIYLYKSLKIYLDVLNNKNPGAVKTAPSHSIITNFIFNLKVFRILLKYRPQSF